MTKLLGVFNDQQVLNESSYAYARMSAYAQHVEELHILVRGPETFTKRADNLFLHSVKVHKLLMVLRLSAHVQRIIDRYHIEIVSAQDPFEFGLIAWLGSRARKLPFTVQLHTDYLSPWFTKSFPMGVANRVRQSIAGFILPRASAIRVVSKRVKDSLLQKFGATIVEPDILPIPSENAVRKNIIHSASRTVVSVSRLEEEKRVEDTLKAFARTRITRPEWKLVILNDGRKRKALVRLARKLNIADAVTFVGFQREPQAFIDEAEIFIQTSSYEGYGMSFVESALLGTPIIATDVGIMGDLLRDGHEALVAPVRDIETIAEKLEALMGSEELRREIAHNARERAEYFASYFTDEYARKLVTLLTTQKAKAVKPKLLYVLPHTDPRTHMRFNVEAINYLSQSLDIFLIVEKGEVVGLSGPRAHKVGARFAPLRALLTYIHLVRARLMGYKRVYIHYSFLSAFLATLLPATKTYYWNCGLPWLFKRNAFTLWYERLVYRRVTHLITGAHTLAREYARVYQFDLAKVIVIPNWIDVEAHRERSRDIRAEKLREALSLEKKDKVLLFIQRLSPRKGAHYIPKLLSLVPEEVKIIIANDGPYKDELVEKLTHMQQLSRVRMTGSVSGERVQELFAISDVFVLLSEEEGVSHALLEAFATGTPAVSFDVGANKELYHSELKDLCVEPHNLEALAKKVEEILRSKPKREMIKTLEYQKVLEYDKAPILESFKQRVVLTD